MKETKGKSAKERKREGTEERERKREREKGLVIFYSNSTRLAIDAGRPAQRTECRIIKDLSHK